MSTCTRGCTTVSHCAAGSTSSRCSKGAPMRRLENKSILVAGCGGIGNELARRYASEGASVVLGDLDGDRARAAVEEITRSGGKATGTRLDGADESSIKEAVTLACQQYGGLDGL